MKTPPAPIPPVFDLLGQEIKEGSFVVYSVASGRSSADTVIGMITGFGWSKPKYSHQKPQILARFRQANPTSYTCTNDTVFEYAKPCGKQVKLRVAMNRMSSTGDLNRFVVTPEDSLPRDFAAFMRARA